MISTIITALALLFPIIGTIIDLMPNIMLDGAGKIELYGIPMIVLFIKMIVDIKREKSEEKKIIIRKKGLLLIFIIYVWALFTLLFLGSAFRAGLYGLEVNPIKFLSPEHFEYNSNLVPFKTISSYVRRLQNNSINTDIALINIFGNLIAFAPFGFFIPLLFGDKVNKF